MNFICGHEFGHASGVKPLKLDGYKEFGEDYSVLEELRSDIHWLNQTLFLQKKFPTEQSWRRHQLVFWGEALHYVVRGLRESRSDAKSANLAFNYMIENQAVTIDDNSKINFNFSLLKRKIQELHLFLEQLFSSGDSEAIQVFIKKYSTNRISKLISIVPDKNFYRTHG